MISRKENHTCKSTLSDVIFDTRLHLRDEFFQEK